MIVKTGLLNILDNHYIIMVVIIILVISQKTVYGFFSTVCTVSAIMSMVINIA